MLQTEKDSSDDSGSPPLTSNALLARDPHDGELTLPGPQGGEWWGLDERGEDDPSSRVLGPPILSVEQLQGKHVMDRNKQ